MSMETLLEIIRGLLILLIMGGWTLLVLQSV